MLAFYDVYLALDWQYGVDQAKKALQMFIVLCECGKVLYCLISFAHRLSIVYVCQKANDNDNLFGRLYKVWNKIK